MVILITGGSGLVGRQLVSLLRSRSYEVRTLGRSERQDPYHFVWNYKEKTIDEKALHGVDVIIHLAGMNVSDKRWNDAVKKEMIDSRVESSLFLRDKCIEKGIQLKTFITASGVNYYGMDTGEVKITEDSPVGTDYFGKLCSDWESAADAHSDNAARIVKLRIGIVLAHGEGALAKLLKPISLGVGSVLGSGKQWMCWVHVFDLCQLMLAAIEDETYEGAYNAISPEPIRHRAFTKTLAKAIKRLLLLPPVPGFMLKLILGEFANVLLGGNKAYPKRLQEKGFHFEYTSLKQVMEEMI